MEDNEFDLDFLDGLSNVFHHFPSLGRGVGQIIADYAVLESYLVMVLAYLSNTPPEQSFRMFFSLRSLQRRQELLESFAGEVDGQTRGALKKILKRFAGAARQRTSFAHCAYLAKTGGPWRIILGKAGVEATVVSADTIKEVLRDYQDLASDILVFCAVLSMQRGYKVSIGDWLPERVRDLQPLPSSGRREPRPLPNADAIEGALLRLGLTLPQPKIDGSLD